MVEVQRYLTEQNILRTDDPLQYWGLHFYAHLHQYRVSGYFRRRAKLFKKKKRKKKRNESKGGGADIVFK